MHAPVEVHGGGSENSFREVMFSLLPALPHLQGLTLVIRVAHGAPLPAEPPTLPVMPLFRSLAISLRSIL